MRIIDHFSVYQRLPIKIDDIRDFIIECGYATHITYFPTDCDPNVMAGMLRLWERTGPYVTPGDFNADIIYSTRLTPILQRLIIAKELLHICDAEHFQAKTREQVSGLITEINIPTAVMAELKAAGSKQLWSDRNGLLQAIAVLLPEEAMEELRPAYESGKLGEEELAALCEVPPFTVQLVMSNQWKPIVEAFRKG